MPRQPQSIIQSMLALGDVDGQIDPRTSDVAGEQPEDDRPRRPTPCPECNSRVNAG